MALAAATVWEIRTAGNDTNGGAFVTGASGTDHSQQDASQYSVTDGVTAGTTTITSATANFGTDVVGNIMYVQGGTGSVAANRYQITARASSTSITVDRSTGLTTGTGVTLIIGGALKSPGIMSNGAPTSAVSENKIWIKAGTYSITNTTSGTAGSIVGSLATLKLDIEGYQTTRGDLGTKPLLQASGIATTTLWTMIGDGSFMTNISLDGASLTSIRGFNGGGNTIYRCEAVNCTNFGFNGDTDCTFVQCLATGCTTAGAGFRNGNFIGCVSHSNTVVGFNILRGNVASRCIAYGNTGATTDGFLSGGDGAGAINCVSYGNGRDGFRFANNGGGAFNSIAEGNTGYGFFTGGGGCTRTFCATYNNTAGATNGTFALSASNITGSASYFTNGATADFTLNNTAGGGATARATGYPGTLPT